MKLDFCCICGRTDNLHHHHIIPRNKNGGNEETNLITLCVKHHAWIHNMRPGTWNNHSESIKSGLENARKKGRIGGRPTKLTPSVEEKILELKANGVSIKKIKEECGVGTASVYKVIKVRNFSHVVE